MPPNTPPFVDLGPVVVHTSPRLRDPEWTYQPYLRLDGLDCRTGPAIDRAAFEYRYGFLVREDAYNFYLADPLILIGQFVRVTILDATDGIVRQWYGVIEAETNDLHGLSLANGSHMPSGVQRFEAFGLLRMLERVFIRSSVKFTDPGETANITLSRGIPFNMTEDGDWGEVGNRSAETSGGGTFVFADAPELGADWTAYTAAEYLLANLPPVDGFGQPVAQWQLVGDREILDWYIIHEQTEGRSLKDLLDALIPRKRAVGYWVDYDEAANIARVNLFSINGSDLILPTGVIPANPNQKSLAFDSDPRVARATLRNVITTRYHEVVARGEPRTSTLTLRFNPQASEFVTGWSSALEADFLTGATADENYAALSQTEKYAANARVRASDRLATVFRRFQISDAWTQRTGTLFAEGDTREWIAFPLLDQEVLYRRMYMPGVNDGGIPLWPDTLRIRRQLALRANLDYSGTRIMDGTFATEDADDAAKDTGQYLRPIFFVQDAARGRFHLLENLALTAAFETDNRQWSIEAEISGRGPVLDLGVRGGPQQFLAAGRPFDPRDTDPQHDPEKNGGVDYSDFFATVTLDSGEPVEFPIVIAEAPAGSQHRRLYIDVPDARLDYVVPYTVLGIEQKTTPIQSESGGWVRDDRARLELIARSAAAWYGTPRQTLEISMRAIGTDVELGDLITNIADHVQQTGINTVVTRLSFIYHDPRNAYIEIETSFPEFDLL